MHNVVKCYTNKCTKNPSKMLQKYSKMLKFVENALNISKML
jgi:hypothetical protein